MRLKSLFGLWFPLAVSFELMMLEGPTVQGAIGRLADPQLHLAAMGLALSLSLLIESPVIMLLATAIALVHDEPTFRALRRFTVYVLTACTLLTGLFAFTPLFDLVARVWMRQPPNIVHAARPAMQIMLLWTAAIAWRRLYQGVLVKYGETRKLSLGTAFRLLSAVLTVLVLIGARRLPGAQVGAFALMAGVLIEALAITLFARPLVANRLRAQHDPLQPELTQRRILAFHAPLAATMLLTLLAQPMTSAALARLPESKETLAAWPVAFMLLLIMRGWGFAVQEITVAHYREVNARASLQRFAWMVGGITSLCTLLIVVTPLIALYFNYLLRLPIHLQSYARIGAAVGVMLPCITALGSWARGVLVAARATGAVYRGMGVNLFAHASLLGIGIGLQLPGMLTAAGAFSLAAAGEFAYLLVQVRRITARSAGLSETIAPQDTVSSAAEPTA